ncbi:hypothetical protein C7B65_08035 [Phormidesmis priestleyi ULC007]|uniref:Uncharacterized protein n=1 Tax=Phormidesmis priestleyi ULC007 TaxID=1920490 RepID=A0A2T1DIQ5_9CYAN|nr:hypothetical protein C7B65_08035 [Phormidesmis priestleyi ULC007]PZO52955.1 MAG: hypothetical protein DCF14_04865 [Phormidesmis priestleyi]
MIFASQMLDFLHEYSALANPSPQGTAVYTQIAFSSDGWGSPPKFPILGDFDPRLPVSKSPIFEGFRGQKPLKTKRNDLCIQR